MASQIQFAEPMAVGGPAECRFYHSMDLPTHGPQAGDWDLRGRFDEYVAGADFTGKSVLDVGAASGFLSFEAEKRGGRVVSLEARDPSVLDRLPFAQHRASKQQCSSPDELARQLHARKLSYWLAHRELGSRNRVYYGDARDLPAALGLFDVVMVGQILVHLSDLITALTSISARCRSTLIIAEGMIDEDRPISHFLGREDAPGNDRAFWHHSVGLYRELLGILGFGLIARHAARYPCRLLDEPGGPVITTLLFQRRD